MRYGFGVPHHITWAFGAFWNSAGARPWSSRQTVPESFRSSFQRRVGPKHWRRVSAMFRAGNVAGESGTGGGDGCDSAGDAGYRNVEAHVGRDGGTGLWGWEGSCVVDVFSRGTIGAGGHEGLARRRRRGGSSGRGPRADRRLLAITGPSAAYWVPSSAFRARVSVFPAVRIVCASSGHGDPLASFISHSSDCSSVRAAVGDLEAHGCSREIAAVWRPALLRAGRGADIWGSVGLVSEPVG